MTSNRLLSAIAILLSLYSVPLFAADIKEGQRLFQHHCVSCHGIDGAGVMPGLPNFKRNEGLMKPDQQLMESVRTGKGMMPAYQGVFEDEQILSIIAYLRTLR